jgi:hypothetical protein
MPKVEIAGKNARVEVGEQVGQEIIYGKPKEMDKSIRSLSNGVTINIRTVSPKTSRKLSEGRFNIYHRCLIETLLFAGMSQEDVN